MYVDIEKRIDVPAFTTDSAFITLQGGTAEGSVYVNAITIHYDAPTDVVLESPLGWSYEKLSKKGKISEGIGQKQSRQDVVCRAGCRCR